MYIKYESGEAVPPVKTVVNLANFYHVPYDVILEDQLKDYGEDEEHPAAKYEIAETGSLELHDSGSSENSELFVARRAPSYYLNAILQMLPKLVYQEQLKVLAKISGMVQAATEEKLKPDRRMQAYQKLEELVKKYHPNSHGQKWTREELYER